MSATDILVDTTDPAWLDRTLSSMPGITAQVVGGQDGPFPQVDGYYVVRVFGDITFFRFAVENQGYCIVVKELEELV